jgi:RNA polymerase sigma-70 factor (ECF subfamily)
MARPEPTSDAELARRSAGGDRDAFVQLMHRHEGALAGLIRHMVSDPHEAEDLLQETLLRAWASIGGLSRPSCVRAWLLQIARNLCSDHYRARTTRSQPTDDEQVEFYLARRGRELARLQERAQEAHEALARLPAPEGEMARLFYLEGMTIREISQRQTRPQGTVRRMLYDARRHMRRTLGVTSNEKERKDE